MTTNNDTTGAGETLREAAKLPREIYATEAAAPHILAATPCISQDRLERLQLHLQGGEAEPHPDDVYPVHGVKELIGCNLVAVITASAVFLMTTDEYHASIPVPDQGELDAQDVASQADGLLTALISTRNMEQFMTPAALTLWKAGLEVAEGGRDSQARLGYTLALDAIIASPGLLDQAARDVRQALLDCDPDLALLGEAPVSPMKQPPLAIHHDVDGSNFEVRPDGSLTIGERFNGAPFVQLTQREAYALLMFMRSPAVVGLLEAQNAAQQTQSELDFQQSVAEERALEINREQVLAWLEKDDGLRFRLRRELLTEVEQFVEEIRAKKAKAEAR